MKRLLRKSLAIMLAFAMALTGAFAFGAADAKAKEEYPYDINIDWNEGLGSFQLYNKDGSVHMIESIYDFFTPGQTIGYICDEEYLDNVYWLPYDASELDAVPVAEKFEGGYTIEGFMAIVDTGIAVVFTEVPADKLPNGVTTLGDDNLWYRFDCETGEYTSSREADASGILGVEDLVLFWNATEDEIDSDCYMLNEIMPGKIGGPVGLELARDEVSDDSRYFLTVYYNAADRYIYIVPSRYRYDVVVEGQGEATIEGDYNEAREFGLTQSTFSYLEGDNEITVNAAPAPGWKFSHLEAVNGEDIEFVGTSFIGPEEDVVIKAVFEENVIYEMIEGDDGVWAEETPEGLAFRSNADFAKFDHVEVDGNVVDPANYEAKEGSTIINLKQSYLETLSVGEHVMNIVSSDGMAKGNFTVTAKAEPTPAPTEPEVSPKTGDAMGTMAAVVIIMIAGLGVVAANRKRER